MKPPEAGQRRLVLAPMEGLTDHAMRRVLTRLSSYDWCVSEFLRITDRLLPERSFFHHVPELASGARTEAGTPVHIQLLGSDPVVLAENAARAAELGAPAIDLNFGCPAKTVNRHRGGAALLAESALLHDIVAAVRRAVPADIPVSAKMRLGIDDAELLLDNAAAIHSAGADWLTLHARTRAQGYRPPVDWPAIGRVREMFPDWPILANGDIRCAESAELCRQESATSWLMVGRAAVSEPDLVARLRDPQLPAMAWPAICQTQLTFLTTMGGTESGGVGRYKQWLGMTASRYPEAAALFQQVKRCRRIAEIEALAAGHLRAG